MDLFSDDQLSANQKDRQSLERLAIADAGGVVIGSASKGLEDRRVRSEKARQSDVTASLTALEIALQNTEYQRLWTLANQAVQSAQTALDSAILENADHLDALEGRSAKLEDGRAVYLSKDGRGRTKDGEMISAEIMAALIVPQNAPGWEEYETALRRQQELSGYSDEVAHARNRMNDPEHPLEPSELDKITKRMDEIEKAVTGGPTPEFNHVAVLEGAQPALDFNAIPEINF